MWKEALVACLLYYSSILLCVHICTWVLVTHTNKCYYSHCMQVILKYMDNAYLIFILHELTLQRFRSRFMNGLHKYQFSA
jgi:hypothetical protein